MTVDTADAVVGRKLRRRGALILALFALVWAAAGASGVASAGGASTLVGAVAVALTAVAVVYAVRSGAPGVVQRPRRLPDQWYRRVGRVNLAQFAGIVVAVAVLAWAGAPAFVPPVVCLIVGAHFFPLARLFDQPQYRWTGAGLTVVAAAGLVGLATGASMEAARAVVGIGAALALWATSVHVARRG